MATLVKTLKDRKGNLLVPRTVSIAVTMMDGTTLDFAINNIKAESIKIPKELAESQGLVEGVDLTTFLMSLINNTSNTLATAEVVE